MVLEKKGATVTVGVEEKLSPAKGFLFGLQHVFVSNVWLDPIYVAALIGLPLGLSANMVNAIFIAAGLVTLIQATKFVRLPVIQGPSAAFDALIISAGKSGNLAAAGGGIIVSAIIVFFLAITGMLSRMKSFFTPVVTGTVIFIVGVALSSFTLELFLGGTSSSETFLDGGILTMSIATSLIVLLLSNFGQGKLRSYSFLIALVIGDLIGLMLGYIDFSVITESGWIGLPHFLPYGALTFDWVTFGAFFFAYIVAVIEAMGVYHAAAEMVDVKLDDKRIRGGFAGESIGSLASTLIGGFPTTAYGQNVGLIRLTGVGSRHAVKVAAVIFLVLGFVPKAGALLAVTPHAVVGGIFLPAAASLIFTGLNILGGMKKTDANFMIAGLSILLAIALPDFFVKVEGGVGDFLGNTILVGGVSAIILQLILIQLPGWFSFKKGGKK